MKRNAGFLLMTIICGGIFSISAAAQALRATSFEVISEGEFSEYSGGKLNLTINGKQKIVAEQANDAWIIDDGKSVVYSARDGAGGYENEGQSLHIYEVATERTRKITAHYYMITGLSEAKLKNGQTALLVRMQDGGLGGSYFAVVDPARGEVFFRAWAELGEVKNDAVKLLFYEEPDWETINQERGNADLEIKTAFPPRRATVKPSKIETHDLNKILKGKVIRNKPTMEILNANLKNAKIYLWRANDNQPGKDFVLEAVEREVSSITPLAGALAELFLGSSLSDEQKGLVSPTFGMKYEGVVLKNGTATVKFSQPADERNYGTMGPFIFLEAIEKTAKQFPSVKRVAICAVGETLFDAQLEKPFPRCAK